MSGRRAKTPERRIAFEAILFAIEVHGSSALFDHIAIVRELYKQERTSFEEIAVALADVGMTRRALYDALYFRQVHGTECACWDCVFRLQAAIIRGAARRTARNAASAAKAGNTMFANS